MGLNVGIYRAGIPSRISSRDGSRICIIIPIAQKRKPGLGKTKLLADDPHERQTRNQMFFLLLMSSLDGSLPVQFLLGAM